MLSAGIGWAFLGLIIAAVICHFFFYMVPAMLGVKTGLPLYVVGTSTYGVRGGLYMPGFLMGLLQFGWLGVNAFAVAEILCKCFGLDTQRARPAARNHRHGVRDRGGVRGAEGHPVRGRVATYLPLIPVVVLVILLVYTWGGLR